LPAESSVEFTLHGMVGHQLHVQTLFPNYFYRFITNPIFRGVPLFLIGQHPIALLRTYNLIKTVLYPVQQLQVHIPQLHPFNLLLLQKVYIYVNESATNIRSRIVCIIPLRSSRLSLKYMISGCRWFTQTTVSLLLTLLTSLMIDVALKDAD
jgi:hypothetical protein